MDHLKSVPCSIGLERFYCVYRPLYIRIDLPLIYVYTKISLKQPTMEPILSGTFREVVDLES